MYRVKRTLALHVCAIGTRRIVTTKAILVRFLSRFDAERSENDPSFSREERIWMTGPEEGGFDAATYLAKAGLGRRIIHVKPKHTFFSQGDPAAFVFYLQRGRAKLTVVSDRGKEATITLFSAGDFIGEETIAAAAGNRLATATAISACTAVRIERSEMIRVMHEEHAFSDLFLKFMIARSIRTQADLIDQLFNSSEKRLARALLLMAEFGKPGEQENLIPEITQKALADMVGTTRSRVSFFMNRFRKLGFVDYNGRIRVNKSLLNVILYDQLPDSNAAKPPIVVETPKAPTKPARSGRRNPKRESVPAGEIAAKSS